MSNLIETANRLERMHPDWSRERCLGEAVRVAAAPAAPAVGVPPMLTPERIGDEWRRINNDDSSWDELPHIRLARWVEAATRAACGVRS